MPDIDEAFLNELAEDLALEDLRTVADIFEADMQRLNKSLVVAAMTGELEAYRRAAHAIAGAAAAVGATALEQTARAAMKQMDPAMAAAEAADMGQLAARAVTALAGFMAARSRMA